MSRGVDVSCTCLWHMFNGAYIYGTTLGVTTWCVIQAAMSVNWVILRVLPRILSVCWREQASSCRVDMIIEVVLIHLHLVCGIEHVEGGLHFQCSFPGGLRGIDGIQYDPIYDNKWSSRSSNLLVLIAPETPYTDPVVAIQLANCIQDTPARAQIPPILQCAFVVPSM